MQRQEIKQTSYDHLFKLLLVGDAKTGKTVLLERYNDDSFTESYEPTIGVDFKTHSLDVDDKCCKLQIWDVSGQKRYREIVEYYYPGVNAILLCFDLTNKESFEKIKQWKHDVKFKIENSGGDPNKVAWFLVGTKSDLTSGRVVSKEEAQTLTKEIDATHFETSAKTGENVKELFTNVATQSLVKVPAVPQQDSSAILNQKPFIAKTNSHNACSFFSVFAAGAVGGACVGAGVGLIFSGATFGSSVIAGMVIGAFLGAIIAAITYSCALHPERFTCSFS